MNSMFEELKTLRRQKPFVPFVIILKNGHRIEVKRPLQYAFNEQRGLVLDDRDRVDPFRLPEIAEIQLLHPVS